MKIKIIQIQRFQEENIQMLPPCYMAHFVRQHCETFTTTAIANRKQQLHPRFQNISKQPNSTTIIPVCETLIMKQCLY